MQMTKPMGSFKLSLEAIKFAFTNSGEYLLIFILTLLIPMLLAFGLTYVFGINVVTVSIPIIIGYIVSYVNITAYLKLLLERNTKGDKKRFKAMDALKVGVLKFPKIFIAGIIVSIVIGIVSSIVNIFLDVPYLGMILMLLNLLVVMIINFFTSFWQINMLINEEEGIISNFKQTKSLFKNNFKDIIKKSLFAFMLYFVVIIVATIVIVSVTVGITMTGDITTAIIFLIASGLIIIAITPVMLAFNVAMFKSYKSNTSKENIEFNI